MMGFHVSVCCCNENNWDLKYHVLLCLPSSMRGQHNLNSQKLGLFYSNFSIPYSTGKLFRTKINWLVLFKIVIYCTSEKLLSLNFLKTRTSKIKHIIFHDGYKGMKVHQYQI